jgi:hypothetical protein
MCVRVYVTGVMSERSQNQVEASDANLRTGCSSVEGSGGGGMEKAATESSLHGERPSDHCCSACGGSVCFQPSSSTTSDEGSEGRKMTSNVIYALRTHACIHTYTHTYIHTYTHMHTHIRTYVRTYIHTYIRTYIHTHVCTHVCMCMCACMRA